MEPIKEEPQAQINIAPAAESSSKKKSLIAGMAVLIVLLLTAVGYLSYENFKLRRELSKTEDKDEKIRIDQITETPPADPTANWKIYTNTDLSFRYPSDWVLDEEEGKIVGSNPLEVVVSIASAGASLADECMVLNSVEERDNFVVKMLSSGPNKGACKTAPSNLHEWLIVPLKDSYGPGISYRYSVENSPDLLAEADNIFTNILSTFKFLDRQKLVPTPASLKKINYELPLGWKTIRDASNQFEIGFDPDEFIVSSGPSSVALYRKKCCFDFSIRVEPYDGGSRHNLLNQHFQGYGTTLNTFEKNYLVDGRSGLVIYNVDYSLVMVIGMINIDGKSALVLSSNGGNESQIEQILSTIKILDK